MSKDQPHTSTLPYSGASSSPDHAARPAQPVPSSWPPPTQLRLHRAIALLGALTQAAVVANQWRSEHSAAGKAYTVAVLLPTAALAASTWLTPSLFWRRRSLLWSAARIGLYAIPSFRSVG
jgi:hypothetical protein